MAEELRQFAREQRTPFEVAAGVLYLDSELEKHGLIPDSVGINEQEPLSLSGIARLCQEQGYLVAAFAILGLEASHVSDKVIVLAKSTMQESSESNTTYTIPLQHDVKLLYSTNTKGEVIVQGLMREDAVQSLTPQERMILSHLLKAHLDGNSYVSYEDLAKMLQINMASTYVAINRIHKKIAMLFNDNSEVLYHISHQILEIIRGKGIRLLVEEGTKE